MCEHSKRRPRATSGLPRESYVPLCLVIWQSICKVLITLQYLDVFRLSSWSSQNPPKNQFTNVRLRKVYRIHLQVRFVLKSTHPNDIQSGETKSLKIITLLSLGKKQPKKNTATALECPGGTAEKERGRNSGMPGQHDDPGARARLWQLCLDAAGGAL